MITRIDGTVLYKDITIKEAIEKGLSLDDANIENEDFSNMIIHDTSFKGATIINTKFDSADLDECYFNGATLYNVSFYMTTIKSSDFTVSNLDQINFNNASISTTDFVLAVVSDTTFNSSDIVKVNFTNSQINTSSFNFANINSSTFNYAILSKVCVYMSGIWNTIFENVKCYGCNINNVESNKIPYVSLACPSEGSFIGWKVIDGCLIKLLIPEDAKRSSATTHKCRCSKAKVLDIINLQTNKVEKVLLNTNYYPNIIYKIGEMVYPNTFDENRLNECAYGIHFFVDKQEAINYYENRY